MKRHRLKKPKKRENTIIQGGLEKLKAGQGRLVFFHSTGNRILRSRFTEFYRNAGIDTS